MMSGVRATILVATRNRADQLDRCLTSIERDRSCADREVVVVDNGSTDHTRDVLAGRDIVALYLDEAGNSLARNHGVRAARGEVIVFTDDDVTVQDGWTAAMLAPFDDPEVLAVGGRVIPVVRGPVEGWMQGRLLYSATLVDYGTEDRDLTGFEMPFGANMAIRGDLLEGLAEPFSPRLGHSPKASLGWEEWHLLLGFARVGRIAYASGAVVEHHVESSRLEWAALRRKHFLGGIGVARHLRLDGVPEPGLARRVVRVVRTMRAARRLRRDNVARSAPTSVDAWREFDAYISAGRHVETLVGGRFPRLADAIAARALL
jgi:glucosyl-dolichyl phosphate glucuronosyltransferase